MTLVIVSESNTAAGVAALNRSWIILCNKEKLLSDCFLTETITNLRQNPFCIKI